MRKITAAIAGRRRATEDGGGTRQDRGAEGNACVSGALVAHPCRGGIHVSCFARMKHEAWTLRDWEKDGITWVVVVRERTGAESDGWVEAAAFLVDAWCLGVKGTFVEELPRTELGELLDHYLSAEERESLEPACARKLVEGGVAYAQSMGFLPQRDFRKTRKILAKIDASLCTREFTFGRDGKPCFVVGPDDDEARVRRVLAILTARFGEDGFGFESAVDEEADAEAEEAALESLDGFYGFIRSGQNPDRSLTIFSADGFITASISLYGGLAPHRFVPGLFGGKAPEFPDNDTRGRFEAGLSQLSFETSMAFADANFVPALPSLGEDGHREAAADFCRGLLRALEANAEGMALVRANPAANAALDALEKIAAPSTSSSTSAAGVRDLAPVIGENLHAIHLALVPLRVRE